MKKNTKIKLYWEKISSWKFYIVYYFLFQNKIKNLYMKFTKGSFPIIVISICLILVLFYLVNHLFICKVNAEYIKNQLEVPYYYGGILSGIFSGLSFLGVLLALFYQNKQAKISEKTFRIQRFETTFFNMLSLQQQIVNDLSFENKDVLYKDNISTEEYKKIQGRELFGYFFKGVSSFIHEQEGMKNIIYNEGLEGYTNSLYTTYFDHYFRHLYTIIKFVDKDLFLSSKDKYKYTSIVRATLSRYELVWLYYNCLSEYGEKFKPFIEEYSLLKNMRKDLLTLNKDSITQLKNDDIHIIQYLKEKGFSGTDYEFYLTDKKGDPESYYIGAFYNMKDLNGKKEGEDLFNRWNKFINSLRTEKQ